MTRALETSTNAVLPSWQELSLVFWGCGNASDGDHPVIRSARSLAALRRPSGPVDRPLREGEHRRQALIRDIDSWVAAHTPGTQGIGKVVDQIVTAGVRVQQILIDHPDTQTDLTRLAEIWNRVAALLENSRSVNR